ncbi:GNAT family N-acetyltransferase [Bacillus sp. FSL K6-3431]|uniref:GNAT family N-acetyltransferase n=1 Tax=Bacillus sp. FSL K6-3431 TaxID=2921500 RepID=UPI0030FB35EE
MILFRCYQSGDEREIIRLWNDSLLLDPINSDRFRNLVLLDANFDPSGMQLAFKAGKLVGCVYAVRRLLPMVGADLEPDNGWIPFFFVDKKERGNSVGKKLMMSALQFLKAEGRKSVFFASYAPNYILPGLDEAAYPEGMKFLHQIGFEKLYSPVAMHRNLIGYSYPEEVMSLKRQREIEGYSFVNVEDKDLYELITFASIQFNPDWGRAIREGILRNLPLHRILIVKQGVNIVGFCLYGGYEGIPERFGPFGVDPSQQGKGLGKVLLYEALKNMRAEGLHGAWFLWTGEKTSAGYLYKKAGFEITRQFHVMKITVNG